MTKAPEKSDPRDNPQFRRVVETFLKTPPKPHKKKGGGDQKTDRRPDSKASR